VGCGGSLRLGQNKSPKPKNSDGVWLEEKRQNDQLHVIEMGAP